VNNEFDVTPFVQWEDFWPAAAWRVPRFRRVVLKSHSSNDIRDGRYHSTISGPAARYPCLPNDVVRSVRNASHHGMFHRQINAVGPNRIDQRGPLSRRFGSPIETLVRLCAAEKNLSTRHRP